MNFIHEPFGLLYLSLRTQKLVPIPLKSVSITASVVHAVAQVELTQIYANHEDTPIEAVYIFPVDSNGAVTHFSAELDGRSIQGVVKPNEDAQRDYDAAVSNQQTAFLGGEVKPDIFKLKIGFLKPNSIAKVIIGYVTEVNNDPDTNSIRFFIPTTVAPRYVPGSETDKSSTDLARMSHSVDPPAPLNIKVVACIQGGIKSVRSLSNHEIRVESRGPIPEKVGWTKAVVTLDNNVTEMDRDFVLLVTPEEAVMQPRIYTETLENGSTAMMAHLLPSFSLKEVKSEFVILLDRSGSMGGNCIRMARTALQLFLHSMPADCYFNIIGFGSSFQVLFYEGSRRYDEDTLRFANGHAQQLLANLGGTELMAPLTKIYSYPCIPGYTRQIFVLSDGEVSNTDEVITLVKRNSSNSRLFSLGIGSSCSHHLIEGIAKAGNGTCAFVENEQGIHSATLNLLKNALQPSLNDVKVEWVGVSDKPVELNSAMTLCGYNKPLKPPTAKFLQAPKHIPPIFDGRQMVILAIFLPSVGKPSGVKISATSPDGPLSLEIGVNQNSEISEILMLHKLAAIKLVRELELEGFSDKIKQKIIALAVEHGLTSKYTSYIAVDHLGQSDYYSSPMQRRNVPSQYPGDHGNLPHKFNEFDCFMYTCIKPRSRSRSPPTRATWYEISGKVEELMGDIQFDALGAAAGEDGSADLASIPFQSGLNTLDINSETSLVLKVVNFQSFEGYFTLSEDLCNAINVSYQDVINEITGKTWTTNAFATLLAIHFLRGLHETKDLWELVTTKAMKWVEQNCANAEIMKGMEICAKKLMSK